MGKSVAGYRLDVLEGAGPTGMVFSTPGTAGPNVSTRLAIKIFHREVCGDPQLLGRVIEERRAVSALDHECCSALIDAGETPEGFTYFVRPWFDGQSLETALSEAGQFSSFPVLELAEKLASLLNLVGNKELAHGNLKPSNIFLLPKQESQAVVKVVDFGTIHLLQAAQRVQPGTSTENIIGLPHYMSPEQVRGKEAEPASDLYALAVIVYRALTGRLPFGGQTFSEIVARILTEEAQPPSEAAPRAKIPEAVNAVILQALSKESSKRQHNAEIFIAELKRALGDEAGTIIGKDGMLELSASRPSDELFPSPRPTSGAFDETALAGRKIGNYVLKKIIGSGGMGTVYLAIHPALGRRVAIKVLAADVASERGAISRLLDEARASTAIGHKNIVEVIDFGETDDGITYLVMEYLEGQTLGQVLKRKGRLPPTAVIKVATGICAGLAVAHDRGIIHRDIKPANIFLAKEAGGQFTIKILDFGIAKLMDAIQRTSPKTTTGAVMGTPYYMAPEQALGGTIDGRTDLFALGLVLYQSLTGTRPFDGETYTQIMASVLTDDVPPMRDAAPGLVIPSLLENCVLKAISKEPSQRQPDMRAFSTELNEALRTINSEKTGDLPSLDLPDSTDTGFGSQHGTVSLAPSQAKPGNKVDGDTFGLDDSLSTGDSGNLAGRNDASKVARWPLFPGILIPMAIGATIPILAPPLSWAALGASSLLLLIISLHSRASMSRLQRQQDALTLLSQRQDRELTQKGQLITEQQQLKRFLSPAVADSVLRGEISPTVHSERKKLSVIVTLMDDFFAQASRLQAEERAKLVGRFYGVLTDTAQRFGATIAQLSNTGATLMVGSPASQGEREDALTALRFSLEVVRLMEDLLLEEKDLGPNRIKLIPKVGIHTAFAMVGNFGSETRLQYTAIGEALEIAECAARLPAFGCVCLTYPSRMLCIDEFSFEPLGRIEPASGEKSIQVFQVKPTG